jgi:hypothetical protein
VSYESAARSLLGLPAVINSPFLVVVDLGRCNCSHNGFAFSQLPGVTSVECNYSGGTIRITHDGRLRTMMLEEPELVAA